MDQEPLIDICANCGTYTELFGDNLCINCYNDQIDKINESMFDEQGIDVPENECHEETNAIDKYIETNSCKFRGAEEKTECLVCFEPLKENEDVVYLPCIHHFHTKCIYPWLRTHNICPVCRTRVEYH